MIKKAYFIINPVAGKGAIKNHLLQIIELMTKAGYEVTVYPTADKKEDGYRKVLELENQDLIMVSGGDGTLRDVISGCIDSARIHCPIGYLPAGTTNDFANTLNLSKDIIKSVGVILNGTPQAIDIGKFNQTYFVYVAAFGAFTQVAYRTPQRNKTLLGRFAYVLEGVTQLSQLKGYVCTVETSQQTVTDEFIFGMVSNSDSVGGIKGLMGLKAELSDGLFEVLLIKKPKQLAELHNLVAAIVGGKGDHESVLIFKTNHVKIYSKEPAHWTLDGEDGGLQHNVEIHNVPCAVQIIVKQ